MLPYYCQEILPRVLRGERVVVAAHGNSLRALVMVLDRLTPQTIPSMELETGIPLVYRLNADSTVASKTGAHRMNTTSGCSRRAQSPAAHPRARRRARGLRAGGASVSFMEPFSKAEGRRLLRRDRRGGAGGRACRVRRDATTARSSAPCSSSCACRRTSRIAAKSSKMLVHRKARKNGIGMALMQAAERHAAAIGKTLITLDTASATPSGCTSGWATPPPG